MLWFAPVLHTQKAPHKIGEKLKFLDHGLWQWLLLFLLLSPAWFVQSSMVSHFQRVFSFHALLSLTCVYDSLLHQMNPFNFCIFTQKQEIVPIPPYPTVEHKSESDTWVRTEISDQIQVWMLWTWLHTLPIVHVPLMFYVLPSSLTSKWKLNWIEISQAGAASSSLWIYQNHIWVGRGFVFCDSQGLLSL